MRALAKLDYETLDDRARRLIGTRDPGAVRLVTGRNNQRLFRAAWGILRNRAEAEDAVQSAYLRGFAGIDDFEGRSSLSTWLTRIAINEALGRPGRQSGGERSGRRWSPLDYRENYAGSMSDARRKSHCARRCGPRWNWRSRAARRVPAGLRPARDRGFDRRRRPRRLASSPPRSRPATCAPAGGCSRISSPNKDALSGTFPFAGVDCEAMTARVVQEWCKEPPLMR